MSRLKDWRWVVVLGCLGWVALYAGRAVLSPALGAVGQEWGLGEGQLGALSSGFFLGYAAMQIPTGLLADRLGRKGILVGGLVAFAASTALCGPAPTYGLFLGAGVLAGLAQGTYYATMFAASTAAVPAARRSLGSAIVYSGMAIGTCGGFLLGSLVTARLGWNWRAPFWLLVAPTLAVALLASFLPRERPRSAGAGARTPTGPRVEAPASARPGARPGGPRAVFTPRLVRVYFLNFTSLYAFFMLLARLPYYLQHERAWRRPPPGWWRLWRRGRRFPRAFWSIWSRTGGPTASDPSGCCCLARLFPFSASPSRPARRRSTEPYSSTASWASPRSIRSLWPRWPSSPRRNGRLRPPASSTSRA